MMRRSGVFASSLLLIALGWPLAVTARAAAETPGWRDADLLNGRLVMSVPPDAEIEGVGADNIMGAAPASDSVTKLKIPADGAEIGWTRRETILSLEASPGGLTMHLFATAPAGSGEMDALMHIAEEELRLTPP